uniref:Uncharacterized protein n=1 Tax=Setaria viridis TaxID=4556 RepID=A0A4U6V8U7_SETVI|nr:hypothetical protein SEVIR_3G072550v2 [Setaria viridis]
MDMLFLIFCHCLALYFHPSADDVDISGCIYTLALENVTNFFYTSDR